MGSGLPSIREGGSAGGPRVSGVHQDSCFATARVRFTLPCPGMGRDMLLLSRRLLRVLTVVTPVTFTIANGVPGVRCFPGPGQRLLAIPSGSFKSTAGGAIAWLLILFLQLTAHSHTSKYSFPTSTRSLVEFSPWLSADQLGACRTLGVGLFGVLAVLGFGIARAGLSVLQLWSTVFPLRVPYSRASLLNAAGGYVTFLFFYESTSVSPLPAQAGRSICSDCRPLS